MKPTIFFLAVGLLAGCAHPRILEQTPAELVRATEIAGLEGSGMDRAVYLEAGDTIPVALSLESEWLGIREESVTLVAKQRVYFWMRFPEVLTEEQLQGLTEAERKKFFAQTGFYLSRDGQHWIPITNLRALKKHFGIRGGSVAFGLELNRQGVQGQLGLKAESEGVAVLELERE